MDASLCRTVTLMTIAANLGSMLTPIGNPQNLYLYSVSGISLGAFLAVTLPYTVLSGVLLALSVFLCYRGTPVAAGDTGGEAEPLDRRRLLGWLVLFAVCLLEVLELSERLLKIYNRILETIYNLVQLHIAFCRFSSMFLQAEEEDKQTCKLK